MRLQDARTRATTTHLPRLAVVAAALATWELVSRTDVNSNTLPTVGEVFGQLLSLLGDPSVWGEIGDTFSGWGISLGIAIVLAVPLGVLLGRSVTAYRSARFVVDFLRTVPGLAVIPLAVLLFGTSLPTELVIVVPTCLWPLLLQTLYGARDVDVVLFDVGKSYGFSRRKVFNRIIIPSCAGYTATGLRLAAIMGLIATIGTELIAGTPGLGFALASAQAVGDDLSVYAYTVLISLVGFSVTMILTRLEREAIPWRASSRPRS